MLAAGVRRLKYSDIQDGFIGESIVPNTETLAFTQEAEIRMQELAEFLARDTRVSLMLTSQLHDAGVLLTPGAFLMLAVPLIESARLRGTEPGAAPTPDAVREAIGGLIASLKTDPAPTDERLRDEDVHSIVIGRKSLFRPTRKPIELGPRENVRSSLSVIRAMWRKFATLSPFAD